MKKRSPYTIEEVKRYAKKKYGECLSEIYINMNRPLQWSCGNPKHKSWASSFDNILKGSWCPECRTEKYIIPLRKAIADFNGEWESGKYINSYTKINVKCKNGHTWSAKPASIMNGSWCATCSHEKKKEKSFTILCKIVKQKDGVVEHYDGGGSLGKAKILCKNGHNFSSTQSKIVQGEWCPKCAIQERRSDLKDIQFLAVSRGGRCLSETYEGAHEKLLFECNNGHHWYAKANAIKNGTWCPVCRTPVGENLVRLLLEHLFKEPFEKSYPPWLKSKEGTQLELDGYCEKLKMAFEHQGAQHFNPNSHFAESFERRIDLDETKRLLCNKHGVRLIEIAQAGEKKNAGEIFSDLKVELRRLKIGVPRAFSTEGFDENTAYVNNGSLETLEKIKEISRNNGGECLSILYGGHYYKLKFRCKVGHFWKTDPATIKRGRWCPECARNSRAVKQPTYNLEDMDRIANEKSGCCLTRTFRDGSSRMEWECELGHRWVAGAYSVIRGTWCKSCAAIERNKRRGKRPRQS